MSIKNLKMGFLLFSLLAFSNLYAQKALPNYEKSFASYDTNHDKVIRFDEFRDKKRNNALNQDAEKLKKIFEKMDIDSNGFIDFEEFKTPRTKTTQNKKTKKVKK